MSLVALASAVLLHRVGLPLVIKSLWINILLRVTSRLGPETSALAHDFPLPAAGGTIIGVLLPAHIFSLSIWVQELIKRSVTQWYLIILPKANSVVILKAVLTIKPLVVTKALPLPFTQTPISLNPNL